jgi:hypothetical protein
MPLLVAVQMYNLPVATPVRSTQASWLLVVALEFLTVDEAHATDRTPPVLTLGQPHVTGGE